jgi:hypothetical protein
MPVFPVTHFQWQVLRAVKRSRKSPTGRELRLAPTRSTKDGKFLTTLIELGLLIRVDGTEKNPFDATYALSDLGKHAAEFGECEIPANDLQRKTPAKKQAKKK